jgi:hypothetical protein
MAVLLEIRTHALVRQLATVLGLLAAPEMPRGGLVSAADSRKRRRSCSVPAVPGRRLDIFDLIKRKTWCEPGMPCGVLKRRSEELDFRLRC